MSTLLAAALAVYAASLIGEAAYAVYCWRRYGPEEISWWT